MSSLLWIILSTSIISLFALVGIFTLSMNEKFLNKILMFLVSLSSGTLLGGAFIHLLPEGVEQSEDPANFFLVVLATIVIYLFIEKVLHWRHCHKASGKCKVHKTIGTLNLIGDSIHNFIDGLIIASTFVVGAPLGFVTFLAIALHEIPQEIGDFGVLLYSGFEKKRALFLNFAVALTVVAGGIVGYFLSAKITGAQTFLLPIAVGGFIYIAASDLIPEIRKETSLRKFFMNFFSLLAGIAIMFLVKLLGGE